MRKQQTQFIFLLATMLLYGSYWIIGYKNIIIILFCSIVTRTRSIVIHLERESEVELFLINKGYCQTLFSSKFLDFPFFPKIHKLKCPSFTSISNFNRL